MSPRVLLAAVAASCLVLASVPAAAADSNCEPVGLATWRARCISDRDAIRSGLGRVRDSQAFPDVDSVNGACEVLAGMGDGRSGAKAHLMALLLSVGSGRVTETCCVRLPSGESVVMGPLIRRADYAVAHADDAACRRALADLRPACERATVMACPDGGHAGSGAAGEDTHSHGRGEEMGRGHEEHGKGHGYGHYKERDGEGGDDEHGGTTAGDGCCRPRTADQWLDACERRDADTTRERVEADCRRDFGDLACTVLTREDDSDCARARRQVVALRLNLASGRLAEECRRADGTTARDAELRATRLVRDGRCLEGLNLARDFNRADGLRAPSRCGSAGSSDDDDDGDEHGDDAKKQQGNGKGKAKGKNK